MDERLGSFRKMENQSFIKNDKKKAIYETSLTKTIVFFTERTNFFIFLGNGRGFAKQTILTNKLLKKR